MKQFLLAYDQGFEHGPVDFDDSNVDPQQIINIGEQAGVFTGIIYHEGIAEKYKTKLPLIIKLNGKTKLHPTEDPYSPQLCTIQKAIELGAKSVGYTIFVGSEHEAKMMQEFSLIEDEAHKNGIGVIAWMYPRGKSVKDLETSRDIVAYAARLGLELGADLVKVPYTGDAESFSWVVKSAGKTGVLAQGGAKKEEQDFLNEASEIMQAGATGMAVGRNIWQSSDPIGLSKKLANVIFKF
jgi:class I fructose-bisphosphate aldolase